MTGAMSWPFLRLYILVLGYFSANAILNVIIPLQGNAWGATNTTIGLIMGAYLLTTMFFRPWAGQMIQQYGPIRILRLILIINAVALLLYTFTGLSGYLIARILQGVSTAFFSMALQMGIIDALPEKDRSQGISLYSLCSYMPGIIAPLLALGIWQSGNMTYFTITMIAIAVFTGVLGYTARIDTRPSTATKDSSDQRTGTIGSLKQLITNPTLFTCSLMMLTASVVFGAVTTFIPLYAKELTGGSAGVYLMIQAATVVIARFTLRKKIPSDGKWHTSFIVGALLLLTIAAQLISLSVIIGAVVLYIGAICMGVAQAILYPTLTTYLSFVLPTHNRNILIGLFIATADLGMSLGSIIMGPLSGVLSYSGMYSICTLLGVMLIVFTLLKRRTMERGINNLLN
ncbi:hypothetical protein PTI45_01667 [Paenibacillus nuruki]|uniref:Major facilitator superfamily (MFS) profile domain-containing protein n=1 Tax=Paenibacillus nuruki TaxID=1886670 RepID=A0A1E3L552_9BACL|nr:MFS transporter [Paenibacillus nuruki]ODP28888.1 hypothetical protein PTI45_01667 [Paenibacillus nuruki]